MCVCVSVHCGVSACVGGCMRVCACMCDVCVVCVMCVYVCVR